MTTSKQAGRVYRSCMELDTRYSSFVIYQDRDRVRRSMNETTTNTYHLHGLVVVHTTCLPQGRKDEQVDLYGNRMDTRRVHLYSGYQPHRHSHFHQSGITVEHPLDTPSTSRTKTMFALFGSATSSLFVRTGTLRGGITCAKTEEEWRIY